MILSIRIEFKIYHFYFMALSYSIGDKADIFVDEKLKRLFCDQGFRQFEENILFAHSITGLRLNPSTK